MAFKDNFRIEKIYFQRVKDDAQTLNTWKQDPRRFNSAEIAAVAKNACDSILMLYRLIGESWNDAINQIERLRAELEALAGKTEAYHDELNEKIDEVNNYLNTQIKNLEIRVENIENSIEAFGGLPSNANAEEGDVLTVGENHINEWKAAAAGTVQLELYWNDTFEVYELKYNDVIVTKDQLLNWYNSKTFVYVHSNCVGDEHEQNKKSNVKAVMTQSGVNKYLMPYSYDVYEEDDVIETITIKWHVLYLYDTYFEFYVQWDFDANGNIFDVSCYKSTNATGFNTLVGRVEDLENA